MKESSIGIDISKDTLDVYRQRDHKHAQFPNTKRGFSTLCKWIGKAIPERVVYEATGSYHSAFESHFQGHLPLVKVNPLHARRFAQACGTRTKTDAVDARMLAHMGSSLELTANKPMAADMPVLKELQAARQALIKDQTRLKNRLKIQTLRLVKRQTKARLDQIARQIDQIDEEIAKQIKTCPKREEAYGILLSIPGLGATTAATILTQMPEIGTLTNKATASLAGLAPVTRQSGKWKGKAFIQAGRKDLRDALYMPALIATRFNPDLKEKYQKMKADGKPSKLAITAIMRKLIILANTLIKDNRMWVKNAS